MDQNCERFDEFIGRIDQGFGAGQMPSDLLTVAELAWLYRHGVDCPRCSEIVGDIMAMATSKRLIGKPPEIAADVRATHVAIFKDPEACEVAHGEAK